MRPARILAAALLAAAVAVSLAGCDVVTTARDLGRQLAGGGGGSAGAPGSAGGASASGYDDAIDDLQPGDCFADPDDDWYTDVVECTELHDNEVTARIDLGDAGSDFPGDIRVDKLSRAACEKALVDYDGAPFAESTLDYSYYPPDETLWRGGDRSVICYGYSWNYDQLEKSFQGAKI